MESNEPPHHHQQQSLYHEVPHTATANTGCKKKKKKSTHVTSFSESPFQKMIRRKRFPCKFVLNIIIFALLCVVVFQYELPRAIAESKNRQLLEYRFLPDDYVTPDATFYMIDHLPTYKFASWDDIRQFLEETSELYYNTVGNMVEHYNYFEEGEEEEGDLNNEDDGAEHCENSAASKCDNNTSSPNASSFAKPSQPQVTLNIRYANLRFAPVLETHAQAQKERHTATYTVHTTMAKEDPLRFLDPQLLTISPPTVNRSHSATKAEKQEERDSAIGSQGVAHTLCAPRKERLSGEYYAPCRNTMSTVLRTPNAASSVVDNVRNLQVHMSFRSAATSTATEGFIREENVNYRWYVTQNYNFEYAMGLTSMTVRVWCARTRHASAFTFQEAVTVALMLLCLWDLGLRLRQIARYRQFQRDHSYLFRENGRLIRDREERRQRRRAFVDEKLNQRSGSIVSMRTIADSSGGGDSLQEQLISEPNTAATVVASECDKPGVPQSNSRSVADLRALLETSSSSTSSSDDGGPHILNAPPSPSTVKKKAAKKRKSGLSGDGGAEKGTKASLADAAVRHARRKRKAGSKMNRHTLGWRWLVWAFATNTVIIIGSVVGLVDLTTHHTESEDLQKVRQILLGLSTFMVSTQFLSYFRHVPRLYFLIEAMYHAIPRLGVFAVNVLPIYFGFAFFGLVVLGPYSPMFSTFDSTCATLAAVIGGDSLLWVYQDAAKNGNDLIVWVSRIYTTAFIFLFIYCALNITLAIVQDSYYYIKKKLNVLNHRNDPQARQDRMLKKLMKFIPTDEVEEAMVMTKEEEEEESERLEEDEDEVTGPTNTVRDEGDDYVAPELDNEAATVTVREREETDQQYSPREEVVESESPPKHSPLRTSTVSQRSSPTLRNGPKTFSANDVDNLVAQMMSMLEAMADDDGDDVDGDEEEHVHGNQK